MNNQVLMIVGMHRSGTSLISQWLYRCGLELGDQLIKADSGNKDGHFEDRDFVNLHSLLLKKRGLSKWGFVENRIKNFKHTEFTALEKLIKKKNGNHYLWAWKDPRTSLFLPLYQKLLPDAFTLVIVRGFNSSVNSLIVRDYKMQEESYQRKQGLSKLKWKVLKRKSLEKHLKKNAKHYLQTWVSYHEEVLNHIREIPSSKVLILHYEDLVEYDYAYFNYFNDAWRLHLKFVPFKSIFKPSLLSEVHDISPHVKDKALLDKAISLDMLFNALKEDSLSIVTSCKAC